MSVLLHLILILNLSLPISRVWHNWLFSPSLNMVYSQLASDCFFSISFVGSSLPPWLKYWCAPCSVLGPFLFFSKWLYSVRIPIFIAPPRPLPWILNLYVQMPTWHLHLCIWQISMSQTELLRCLLKSVPSRRVFQISVNSNSIFPIAQVKNSRIILDLSFSFFIHLSPVVLLALLSKYIQNMKLLTTPTLNFLIHATIFSCLNYFTIVHD